MLKYRYYGIYFLFFLILSINVSSVAYDYETLDDYYDVFESCSAWTVPAGDVESCSTPPCIYGINCSYGQDINSSFGSGVSVTNVSSYAYDTSGTPADFLHYIRINLSSAETYNYVQFGYRTGCAGQGDNYTFYDQDNIKVGELDLANCPDEDSGSNTATYNSTFLTEQEYSQLTIIIEPALTDYGADGYKDYFYQLNLSYVNVTLNELPDFNVTFDNICWNESDGVFYVNLTFNITSYDKEGDTLYWDFYTSRFKNINKSLSFESGRVFKSPNCDVLKEFYVNDSCLFSCSDIYNKYNHNIVERTVTLYSFLEDINKYMLALNSECGRDDKGIYLKYDYSLDNLWTNLRFYSFVSDTEELNFTLYNSVFQEQLNFYLKVNGENISVYNYNGSEYVDLGNYSKVLYDYLDLSLFYFSNNTLPYMTIADVPGGVYTLSNLSNEEIKYLRIANKNGIVYLDYIGYSGIGYIPNFSMSDSSVPMNQEVFGFGLHEIDFYVTDLPHYQVGEYVHKQYSTYVDSCEYYGLKIDDESNILNFPFLLRNYFGESLRNFLNQQGLNDVMKSALYWTFIILIIFLTITQFYFTRRINLIVPLISSSFVLFFASWLIGYSSHMVVFMTFLALGIASPIVYSIVGFGNG